MPGIHKSLLVAGGVAAGLAATRPRLRNRGATPRDRRHTLPGDDLIPDERSASTMAITIHAPSGRG